MEEMNDVLKNIMKNVEVNKEKFKKERSRKLEIIKKANRDVGVEYIKQLEDPIDMITFIEDTYKCINCVNGDECNAENFKHYPRIEYEQGSYGLVYYPCEKRRGGIKANIEIKNYNDYWTSDTRNTMLDILLTGDGGYIYGAGGRGKTYTMAYVCNELNKQGKSIFFHLASYIEKTYVDFKTRNELLENMLNFDIVVVDDFGGHSMNKLAVRGLWETVIKQRLDSNKPIYFTSNYKLNYVIDEIAKVSGDSVLANVLNDRINMHPVLEFKDKNYSR